MKEIIKKRIICLEKMIKEYVNVGVSLTAALKDLKLIKDYIILLEDKNVPT